MSKWVYPRDWGWEERMEKRYERMGIKKVGFFKHWLYRFLRWLEGK